MLQSYLKVALRSLRKNKGYAFINVVGLAMGMTCGVLILLYVQDELKYDRFHENADQIHRVRVERFAGGGEAEYRATASAPMAPAIVNDFPEVLAATRFGQSNFLVEHEDRRFYESRFFWTDSTVFDVFSFDMIHGNPGTALVAPGSLVLTATTARKYFGEANAVGQVLQVDGSDMNVTGVVADIPPQSHIQFDMLGSLTTVEAARQRASSQWNWWSLSYHTYLLVDERADIERLAEGIHELPSRYIGEQESQSGYRQFLYLQALPSIHLTSNYSNEIQPNSDVAYIYIFSTIAVFILLIGCINFMNLSTARSTQRAKEVGMRKVAGANKGQLIAQFLSESIVMAMLAIVLSLVLIQIFLPAFNDLSYKQLSLNYITDWPFTLALLALALVVGVLAGSYPALVISSFKALEVFRGKVKTGSSAIWLRRGLVVFQFAISVMLLIGVTIVYQQLDFMRNQDLGFQKERMVVVNFQDDEGIQEQYEVIKQSFNAMASVRNTTFSSAIPGRRNFTNVIAKERGMTEDGQTMQILAVDYDYTDTYALDLIDGNTFSPDLVTDSTGSFLINEAALRALGWSQPSEAIGTELTRQFGDTREVIGVVKDFHFQSLQNAVEPIVFQIQPNWFNYMTVRVASDRISETLAELESTWQGFSSLPFDYFFLDQDFDRQYRAEERISSILIVFTILAVFIACLGLFGLASFVTEQRTKEIGVRKVLGASTRSIIVLLSKEFTKLVIVAALVAFPIGYLFMSGWLDDFAYRIQINPLVFLFAGLASLLIAWLTVSYQSIRAALAKPVETLKYE